MEAYDLEKENSELIRLYDEANRTGEWEEYRESIWKRLEKLVYSTIHRYHYTSACEFEDLVQGAAAIICQVMNKYDPRVSMPATYFKAHIDRSLVDTALSYSAMNSHYYGIKVHCENKVKEAGFSGLDDPMLTPEKIAELSGKSLHVVKNMFAMTQTSCDLASVDNTEFDAGLCQDPAEIAIEGVSRREDSTLIREALNSLAPYERYLLQRLYLYNEGEKKCTYSTLVKELKDPLIRRKVGITEEKNLHAIQEDEAKACRKLANFPGMKERFADNRSKKTCAGMVICLDEEETRIISL